MADLSYAVHGPRDGPAVLLIHGFPFDRAMWRFQIPALTSAGYRVVVPDLPGFGHSEDPGRKEVALASVEAIAAELVRLLDRLRIAKCVVSGFSMGGYVALAVAAQVPTRLSGLVLIDTRAEADSTEGKAKRDATIAQVQKEGPRGLAMSLLAGQLTEATRKDERLLVEEVRTMMLRQPKASYVAALTAMRDRPDRHALLLTLSCPALVLVGDQDKVTPVESAKAMASALKDAELHVIAGAAHLSPMEQPDQVNEHLVAWLVKHLPAPT